MKEYQDKETFIDEEYNETETRYDKITGILAIIGFVGFLWFSFNAKRFIGYTILFWCVTLILIINLLPYNDLLNRRRDINEGKRKRLNYIIKAFISILLVVLIILMTVPYTKDLKAYMTKTYAIEIGTMEKVTISKNKGRSYNCRVFTKNKEIIFYGMSEESRDWFQTIEKGAFVIVRYLPYSNYGISITTNPDNSMVAEAIDEIRKNNPTTFIP